MRQKPLQQSRTRIAQHAARLMHENGIRDYAAARRKAAQQLGITSDAAMPRNREIAQALHNHLRLFSGDSHLTVLRELREAAVAAMTFFSAYQPRLVGAVLDGSADQHSAVCLHLFTDQAEDVGWYLAEQGIDYDMGDRRLRLAPHRQSTVSIYRCQVDGIDFDLTVLPADGLRQAPLDRASGRPMARAAITQVRQLLAASTLVPDGRLP